MFSLMEGVFIAYKRAPKIHKKILKKEDHCFWQIK